MTFQRVISWVGIAALLLMSAGCGDQTHQIYGYIEGRFTLVSSSVGGILENLAVARGTSVTTNTLLFKLDPHPEINQYQAALADVKKAEDQLLNLKKGQRPSELDAIKAQQQQVRAQIEFSFRLYERAKRLYPKGAIEKNEVDRAEADLNEKKARLAELTYNLMTATLGARIDEINAARATLQGTRDILAQRAWELKQKDIYAPVAGVVFDTFFRTGEVVPANQPILSMLAPENIKAIFFVPEKQLAGLKLNQPVQISCDACEKEIVASIDFISPEAEFTPPVIFSEKSKDKLVYRIEAAFSPSNAVLFHPGQPIKIEYSTHES